ncbi:SMI1/KNR4 family protein [Nocardia macrotermitis]|uniref:Knr4/Smi1-like domain-containing protein n=1 Tax=Nocardia macrotermitis TaxID=2585198 RepID=A0A7K0D535_9NOCA|nr:SMI1/KNR4 family protein [Nocardia macrotermitis]MQY20432.1 hypothetical protein [Nocardia macrotermitis]
MAAITTLSAEQKRWHEADKVKGVDSSWKLTPPNPAATDAEIQAAEQRLASKLDDQLKDWLRHANGWNNFSGGDSLYPASELTRDSHERTFLLETLQINDVTPAELEMDSFDSLIVIGGNRQSYFIVTTGCGDHSRPSAPVWEIDGDHKKYARLEEFIQSTIDLMKSSKH